MATKRPDIRRFLHEEVAIAPVVTFRILYGLLMLFSIIRFAALGWIEKQYLAPDFHFKYYGFDWVQVPPAWLLYALYVFMFLAALGITLGWRYRWSTTIFFMTFTYVELLDKTYYLNHYYFISVVALLMIFIPAHRRCSLDAKSGRTVSSYTISRIYVLVLQLQVAIVYFYAGIAKINHDWLMRAMPMRIWLAANANKPILGALFAWKPTAFVFSWLGMIYDTTIPFFLIWKKTRLAAYLAVIGFHLITGWLFPIGVFPIAMICSALIFFSPAWHERRITWIEKTFGLSGQTQVKPTSSKALTYVLVGFMFIQLVFPFRYILYPGNLFWTEEGYRFSWRVMLMEKAANASFYVTDQATGKRVIIYNREHLTPIQEKMMSSQPDMIIQYAKFLKKHWEKKGMEEAKVTADIFVTLNGRRSKRFTDPEVDLAAQNDTWKHKEWILAD